MTLVVDASLVVAALVDSGPTGTWADVVLEAESLAAPHLMLAKAANVLRRAQLAGELSSDLASIAHADLMQLRVELFDYEPFSRRIWELRHNLSVYDAWHVALAETLAAPLATLDNRLVGAAGPRCSFTTPPS
ncbi:type II toxin-antitoxin system ribonuclease VapC1 [soil metagenome]